MWVPLAALAVPSVIIGYGFNGQTPLLERILSFYPPRTTLMHPSHELHATAGSIALMVVLVGIGLSVLFYMVPVFSPDRLAQGVAPLYTFLVRKWYFDELYDAIFVRPSHRLARFCRSFDWNVLDGFVDGAAQMTVRVSQLDGKFDFRVIDGIVNGVSDVTYATGVWLRRLQTGQIRQYVMFLAVAAVGLLTVIWYLGPYLGPNVASYLFEKK
jgi:NADH-quinone oxidoreductase subunit L